MGLILAGVPDDREWRIMFLGGAVLPVVMIVLVTTVMVESPRWLVSKNREVEAQEILQRIYPPGTSIPSASDVVAFCTVLTVLVRNRLQC